MANFIRLNQTGIESEALINVDNITWVSPDYAEGSTIYFADDHAISVKEDLEEIANAIGRLR